MYTDLENSQVQAAVRTGVDFQFVADGWKHDKNLHQLVFKLEFAICKSGSKSL